MDDAREVKGNCPCQETVRRWLTKKKEDVVVEKKMENTAPGGPPISFITQKEDVVVEKKMGNTAPGGPPISFITQNQVFG